MPTRRRLHNRRGSVTVKIAEPRPFHMTVGYYENGEAGEFFINAGGRVNSNEAVNASDAACIASLAIQYGVPVILMADAVKRDVDGKPQGIIGAALDALLKLTEQKE